MLTSDAIKYYGNARRLAEALGLSHQAVYQWSERVPPLSAARLSRMTSGNLVFNPDDYGNWKPQTRRKSA